MEMLPGKWKGFQSGLGLWLGVVISGEGEEKEQDRPSPRQRRGEGLTYAVRDRLTMVSMPGTIKNFVGENSSTALPPERREGGHYRKDWRRVQERNTFSLSILPTVGMVLLEEQPSYWQNPGS